MYFFRFKLLNKNYGLFFFTHDMLKQPIMTFNKYSSLKYRYVYELLLEEGEREIRYSF